MHILIAFILLMIIVTFWRAAFKALAVLAVCGGLLVAGGTYWIHQRNQEYAQRNVQQCAMNPRPYGLVCP
jgi:hypothetical protein